ncbi:Monooxygenase, FAD-binding protein [Niveomyces insectorum RCEF 264]|uniref:Monooxygenase, FAD-binding protein n=1 Tax=Niveomyces insectorum RCEF 264 TaxID=1081102 RepID=A0A162KBA1_9HYPO|nr:Monooxygenase, FAD-binding protein [Niveomyces insectorum RCEF 264]
MADTSTAGRPFKKVLIVGAGPSGLLLAVLLSQHGIPVQILEAAHELDQQPRAAHYGPPAIPELARAGVMDVLDERGGMRLNTMFWRRFADHSPIAGFDGRVLEDAGHVGPTTSAADGAPVTNTYTRDLRTACLPMQDLDALLLEMLVERLGADVVRWRHRVVNVGQDADKAWAEVEVTTGAGDGDVDNGRAVETTTTTTTRVEADYIVGCDGANSIVRRSLFGNEFPGKTWDAQIIATNTYYDFEGKFGFNDANFIIHPEHFFMAAKITKDGLYRVTYGETPGLDLDEYRARQAWKFETMLPGHPKPGEYNTINFAPYKMHQRCAPKFRVGRVLLAADAAHLCNPWGGLGITGGFVDVGGLADCLLGIWDGRADESILELYSEKRIEKWKTIIDPISSENFRRVSDPDPATRFERDEWLQILKDSEGDAERRKKLLLGSLDVRYDFTQHYKK